MAQATSIEDALRKANDLLSTVKYGLAMVVGHDAAKRSMGVQNVAVFGRSVTFALQNLRTVVGADRFDTWYAPHLAAMKADDLCVFFRDLRNEIVKEGPPPVTSRHTKIGYLDSEILDRLRNDAPPGAARFFIGDHLGGSGWIVELPDGSTQPFYIELPPEVGLKIRLQIPNTARPIDEMCIEYVAMLTAIVEDAVGHFASTSS